MDKMTLERIRELRSELASFDHFPGDNAEERQILDLAEQALTQPRPTRDELMVGLRSIEASLGTLDHSEAIDPEEAVIDHVCSKVAALIRRVSEPRPTLPEALRDIPALLELCTRATPGPWDAENEQNTREKDAFIKITDPNNKRICDTFNADGQEIHSEADEDGVYYFEGGQRSKDMNFIAAARTALPAALEYIQALERKGDL